ncbi:hypothetical protein C7W88_16915 [Novosphingobium sp. THN1]|uniref:hypothetical protein n=1 Tax=Novosphingobium sp. THN1 TaxID=1016987 RepID=UPI000E51B637|nr:hypothetical protein [Novosphingobium sp. THN1]AXU20361.1 hypothetical protein C7W88_16915 [Novosphingobium sp. THN1]
MGYHPETLVASFPPCSPKSRIGKVLYRLSPFIGFDIWHIDPERRSEGQRTDDSCGWFDRRPREYGDAVDYVLKDATTLHEIKLILARRTTTLAPFYAGVSEKQLAYPRLAAGDALALCLMVARELESRRWWNGQYGNEGACRSWWRKTFTKRRDVNDIAMELALDPLDNLSSIEEPGSVVRLIAGALHRRFKPWWKHPRWHVHHWKVNFHLPRNLRRMLIDKCGTCGKRLGWNYCPVSDGSKLHHSDCYGMGAAMSCKP